MWDGESYDRNKTVMAYNGTSHRCLRLGNVGQEGVSVDSTGTLRLLTFYYFSIIVSREIFIRPHFPVTFHPVYTNFRQYLRAL